MSKQPFRALRNLGKKWLIPAALLAALILALVISRTLSWARQREKTKLLQIVSASEPLLSEPDVEFTLMEDGMVDSRCAEELSELFEALRREGFSPVLSSSFRSFEEQQELFDRELERLMAEGMSRESAELEAEKSAPRPGQSEHQLGLAVDIADRDAARNAALWRFLSLNAWRYGFIERYGEGMEAVTHHAPSPEHYRFVGREAAAQIYELGLSLEQYIEMFYS